MAYQGDLAPSALRGASTGLSPYYGLHIGIDLGGWAALEVQLNNGSISADDKNQTQEGRRIRNLNFRSPITDYGALLTVGLPFQWNKKNFGIRPYIGIGWSQIHFNPQGLYQGQWIPLQPLGTEGQGLDRYPDRLPYNLTTQGVLFKAGFSFRFNQNFYIRLEGGLQTTETDYLDDVSTSYPDLDYLSEERGIIAREMSFKGLGNLPNSGTIRGNPNENDFYIHFQFKVGYTLTFASLKDYNQRRKVKCPGY